MPLNPLHRQHRRRKLLRRFAICFLLPILALLTLRLIWGYEASHRLAAALARLRAQGVRLTPEDFSDGDAIPHNQNAYYDLLDAAASFKPTTAERELVDPPGRTQSLISLPRTPMQINELETLCLAHSAAGDIIDDAETRPQAILPRSMIHDLFDYKKPFSTRPNFSQYRFLAEFFIATAVVDHARHQDAHAVHNLRRVVVLARLVDVYPSDIGHLVSTSLYSLAAQSVEELEPRLDMKDQEVAAEAALLVASLQDDSTLADDLPRAFEGEMTGTMLNLSRDLPAHDVWWFRALANDESARFLNASAASLPAMRSTSWPEFKRRLPDWPYKDERDQRPLLDATVLQFENEFSLSGDQEARIHFRRITDGRAAGLLLAIRLYAAARAEILTDIAALVPDFLNHAPIDPYSLAQEPLHFRLDRAGPTVWSVGENGIDEGAPVTFDADGNRRRYGGSTNPAENAPDIVYGAAWRTAIPPRRPAKPK